MEAFAREYLKVTEEGRAPCSGCGRGRNRSTVSCRARRYVHARRCCRCLVVTAKPASRRSWARTGCTPTVSSRLRWLSPRPMLAGGHHGQGRSPAWWSWSHGWRSRRRCFSRGCMRRGHRLDVGGAFAEPGALQGWNPSLAIVDEVRRNPPGLGCRVLDRLRRSAAVMQ